MVSDKERARKMAWITWLRRFSIRSRLIACMAIVVGIGTIVGCGMSWQLWSLKGEFDDFAQQEFTATQRMASLALEMGKLRGHEKATIINAGDSVSATEQYQAWQAALTRTIEATKTLAQAAPSEDIRQHVTALETRLHAYGKGLAPTLEMIASMVLTTSSEAYQSSEAARAEADAVEAGTAQLNAEITQLADARRNQAAASASTAISWLWVLLLSPGVVFLPLMILTIVSITQPLRRAEELTQAISQGDLTRSVDIGGKDEFARLLTSMAKMQD